MYDTQAASCATYPFCWGASPHTLDRSHLRLDGRVTASLPPLGPEGRVTASLPPLGPEGRVTASLPPFAARGPGYSKPTPFLMPQY